MNYHAWQIDQRDIRRSRLRVFSTVSERDKFCEADRLLHVPLEGVGTLPCCRVDVDRPPRVAWLSDERRRS